MINEKTELKNKPTQQLFIKGNQESGKEFKQSKHGNSNFTQLKVQ